MTSNAALLLDTDILIDVGRQIPDAVTYLHTREQTHTIAISTITHLELLIGARNKTEQQKIERFVKRFQLLPIDAAISNTATDLLRQYRLSHGLLLADAFIAATAIHHGIPLSSKNQRDYRFIAQLTLLPYP
jgi:predicted nucleic acid-binding protein